MTYNLVKYAFNGPDVIDSALHRSFTHHNSPGIKSLAQTSTHLHLNTYKKQ